MRARSWAGLLSIAVATAAIGAGGAAAHADTPTCLGVAANVHSEAVIDAAAGEVILVVGDGPHTIVWHGGNDRICGTGSDTLDYSQAPSPVRVVMKGSAQRSLTKHRTMGVRVPATSTTPAHTVIVGTKATDRFTGIANVTGSPFGDHLLGNKAANVLKGGDGDDVIAGHGGADTLEGGNGWDHCVGMGTSGCSDGV